MAWSWVKISSAIVMGAAIPIMHYTGMAAATFTGATSTMAPSDAAHAIRVSSLSIAGIIVVTFLVLGLAVLTSLAGRRFSVQAVELKASARLAAIVESSDDAIISKTLDGTILSWNSGAERMFGYSAQEALGRPIAMLIPQERRTEEPDILARIARGEKVDHFETLRTRKDGRRIDVSETISPMKDSQGKIVGASKIARDITERKVAEAKAKELEERVRARTAQLAEAKEQLAEKAAIVSNSNDAIFSEGLDRVLTSWNPGAERLYGYSAAEMVGREDPVLVPEDLRAELAGVMERIARGELIDSFETVRLRRDGTPIDVHLSISPVRDASGKVRGSSVIARDVTDRKRVEQQFRDTQKLESLGILAGGIAHDFNNLLTSIMGNSSLALESLPPPDPNRALLEQVVLASERASHLTQQMLAFAGKGRFVPEKIDVSALVRKIASLILPSIPKSVEVRLELEDKLPAIEGDSSQLQQLIMNLLTNGAEAIGENRTGTVTVTTETQEVDEAYIRYCGGKPTIPGTYVSLEVKDTGCGMDQETKSRIFDPFFTTKFTGRGLGLAAALGIVRGHRGTIRIDSTPGRGSTFKVLMPSIDGRTVLIVPEEDQHFLRGTETVLVVDDEELVRSTAQATLERFGYTVLTAEHGQAGVNMFRERADEIAAVLLDMTMPVMSGQEAFRQIRIIRPGVRVIVSSGYNEVEAVRRFTMNGIAAFLQKPYTALKLSRLVRRVLES